MDDSTPPDDQKGDARDITSTDSPMETASCKDTFISTESIDTFSSESTILESVEDLIENGKNKHLVKCQLCPSEILIPLSADYFSSEFDLPVMTEKKGKGDASTCQRIRYEQLTHFWSVPNMYTFENIGFSHTVGQIKYLACADCDIGPIGYHDLNSKVSYVALARVCHDK